VKASSWSWVTSSAVVPVATRTLQQQPGARRQRAGQGDALPLAAGQGHHLAVLVSGQAHQVQQLGHPDVPRGASDAGQPVADVPGDVPVREQLTVLEHQPEAASVHRQPAQVGAVPAHRSGGGRLQPRDGAQQ
jgi:hypothetical protein